jgi:hypothetical protein
MERPGCESVMLLEIVNISGRTVELFDILELPVFVEPRSHCILWILHSLDSFGFFERNSESCDWPVEFLKVSWNH